MLASKKKKKKNLYVSVTVAPTRLNFKNGLRGGFPQIQSKFILYTVCAGCWYCWRGSGLYFEKGVGWWFLCTKEFNKSDEFELGYESNLLILISKFLFYFLSLTLDSWVFDGGWSFVSLLSLRIPSFNQSIPRTLWENRLQPSLQLSACGMMF